MRPPMRPPMRPRAAVIAGLLFMAGMRRSEVSALHWADVADSTDGDGMLVTVRRSKTNQEGEVNDVRFVKDGVARALRTLRTATSPEPGDRVVPLSAQMVGLRFTAAAEAAGVERRRPELRTQDPAEKTASPIETEIPWRARHVRDRVSWVSLLDQRRDWSPSSFWTWLRPRQGRDVRIRVGLVHGIRGTAVTPSHHQPQRASRRRPCDHDGGAPSRSSHRATCLTIGNCGS